MPVILSPSKLSVPDLSPNLVRQPFQLTRSVLCPTSERKVAGEERADHH